MHITVHLGTHFPRAALEALLVCSEIAVIIASVSDIEFPTAADVDATKPRLFDKSPEETAKLLDHSVTFPIKVLTISGDKEFLPYSYILYMV